MSTSPVINALITKRSELAGIVTALEQQVAAQREALAHVDATLLMFDPGIVLADIKPRMPNAKMRLPGFAVGDMARWCLETLRDAQGEFIGVGAIVDRAVSERGLEPSTEDRAEMALRFTRTLHDLKARGQVRKDGHGDQARWVVGR